MSRKEILIICLIMCFIFSLHAVAAADVDNTNTNGLTVQNTSAVISNDVSAYSLPDSNTILQAGSGDADSFSELQDKISPGGKITLERNYTWNSSKDGSITEGIVITRNTEIIGNNIVIDAQGKTRMFNIASDVTVTLSGITFINGYTAGSGGSILAQGTVTIVDCNFINNTAAINGGAIDWIEGATFGNVSGSTFINNTANCSGGAISWTGHNGHIEHSNFIGNKAYGTLSDGVNKGDGGAVLWSGRIGTIDNCRFDNNTAAKRGGAVFLQNCTHGNNTNITVSNSIFTYNLAGTNGGAIDWQAGAYNGTVINSVFEHNIANRSGGAIYWSGHNGTIKHSNFTANKALGIANGTTPKGNLTLGGDAGAVMWTGALGNITDCIFISNNASKRGGAVFLQSGKDEDCDNVVFDLCVFEDNIAGTNGGAIDWQAGASHGRVLNSNFTHNIANRSGGAIYWSGHNGTIEHSIFTDNHALGIANGTTPKGNVTLGGDAGAVMWTGSIGKITDSRFVNNTAAKRGGAVFLQAGKDGYCDNVVFDWCTFIDNVAGTNGGAIDWQAGASHGNVSNSVFEHNIANRSGGAIYWSGHNGTIMNSNFTDNHALGIANGTTPKGNVTLGGDAGAVMWTGAIGDVIDSVFINNTAAKRGGAVFLQAGTNESCYNTTFSHSRFINNTAGTNGGAIDWNKGASNGTVEYCTFENNIANRSAGAIFWNGHNGTIRHSNFTNNMAKGIAWAISVRGENDTGGDGGAVMWSGAVGDVIDCIFINNTAAKRGGGVFLQAGILSNGTLENCSDTSFTDSRFENNIAGTNGGAIDWNDGAHNGMVNNVEFINNTAGRNGGAIFWHGDDGTVINSRFDNNRATGENRQYNMTVNMGTSTIVKPDGTKILGNIIVIQSSQLPTDTLHQKTKISYLC